MLSLLGLEKAGCSNQVCTISVVGSILGLTEGFALSCGREPGTGLPCACDARQLRSRSVRRHCAVCYALCVCCEPVLCCAACAGAVLCCGQEARIWGLGFGVQGLFDHTGTHPRSMTWFMARTVSSMGVSGSGLWQKTRST